MPKELLQLEHSLNLRLLDRQGRELRVVASAASTQQQWRSLDQISPWLLKATLASEDRRFYWHPGIDPLAIARATGANWKAGRITQGGSTLAQQLVRMLRESQDRGWLTKLSESYWALRLERRSSKKQILESYLNLAPYGFQTRGCQAAAQLYFDKPVQQLSLAESCFLAVLPRAPESFLPYQEPEEIVVLQQRLLDRLLQLGWVGQEDYRRAKDEPLHLRPLDSTWEAGHFCDYLLSRLPPQSRGEVRTTLDLDLQHEVEGILAVHLGRLKRQGVSNGAVVVQEVESGNILAMVGSGDYHTGQFNACLAGRQPGSTLKPFTYALALEKGYTAASILPDLNLYPLHVEKGYIPQNYDRRVRGPVRLREALACSYNVPVVRLLEILGVEQLLERLRRLGFSRLTESAQHYGLGLTLGAGEVSLLELCQAYRCLARRGRYAPEQAWVGQPSVESEVVIDPDAADLITHILKDPQARIPAFGSSSPLSFGFQCAAKTGTSKGYRDNWAVGYTPLYVVACWVGNFDGTSMRDGVSGITGSAPIFHDVMSALVERDHGSPDFTLSSSLVSRQVCEASGMAPGPDCMHQIQEWFLPRSLPDVPCDVHQRITLDRRSGRRATPDTPRHARQDKVFTVYPPLYRAWALAQGIPQPPPAMGAATPSGEVAIVFPDQGAIFRIEDDLRPEFQRLHLQVVVPEWCQEVEWLIDDQSFVVAQSPFDLWWKLRRGGFVIGAVARGQGRKAESRKISIIVN